jgi:hypothetical protein
MVIGGKGFGVLRRRLKKTLADKMRVRERKTGQTGVVVKAGVEVSEVRWDGNSSTQFCVNAWLEQER